MKLILLISILFCIHICCCNGISRSEVIDRAIFWQRQPVPYSQKKYSKDPNGKLYRTDCSGYVSMTWGLKDSMTTRTLPQVSSKIGKNDLREGDILLDTGSHVVLFHKWTNDKKTHYLAYEQTNPATKHRSIPYPYFSGTYVPYRYKNIN